MIGIINYGAGNLKSVNNALDYLNIKSKIINSPEEVYSVDKLILPGVGSFGFMMQNLRSLKLEDPIKNSIEYGKIFLGICLGFQVLFEKSEESPGIEGLSVFKGDVVKFVNGKIPQIGWNKIKYIKSESVLEEYMYFVNSYYVRPKDKKIISAKVNYFIDFACAIQKDNVTAVQFHPERSGKCGLEFIRRWNK